MFVFGFKFDYPSMFKALGSDRAFDRVAKAAHDDMAHYWHERLLPRHFTQGAAAKYGYQPRTEKYLKRKRRLAAIGKVKSPVRDLVYSGRGQASLRARVNIRVFPTRFSVRMQSPKDRKGKDYILMRPRPAKVTGRAMPPLGAEVTAVNAEDHRDMAEFAGKRVHELMRAELQRRRTRTTNR